MGNSLPPPAKIDLVGSFARRRGSDIELVLWDPNSDSASHATRIELTQGRKKVVGSASFVEDERGRRLVGTVGSSQLSDGQWRIAVLGADASAPEQIEARLLFQGKRPVVLLWGAKGTGSVDPQVADGTVKQRVTRAGVGALDSALSVLPPERAREVRGRIRRVGAKLLT